MRTGGRAYDVCNMLILSYLLVGLNGYGSSVKLTAFRYNFWNHNFFFLSLLLPLCEGGLRQGRPRGGREGAGREPPHRIIYYYNSKREEEGGFVDKLFSSRVVLN